MLAFARCDNTGCMVLRSSRGKDYAYYGVDEYNQRRVRRFLKYGRIAKALKILSVFVRRDLV